MARRDMAVAPIAGLALAHLRSTCAWSRVAQWQVEQLERFDLLSTTSQLLVARIRGFTDQLAALRPV